MAENHYFLVARLTFQQLMLDARIEHLMELRAEHSGNQFYQLVADRRQKKMEEEQRELARQMIMIPNSN